MQQSLKNRYDEVSPITGNLSVLVDQTDIEGYKLTFKICMDTGYTTHPEIWKKENTEAIEILENSLPSYIKEIKFEDKDGVMWYPIVVIDDASLFMIKDDKGDLVWAVYKKPKLEGALAEMSDQMLNDHPEKTFPKDKFEDAWDYYFALPENE